MMKFWYLIYNIIVLPFLFLVFQLAGLFNAKIKKGIKDRQRLFEDLILAFIQLDKKKKMVWVHSSSMGEFEQAKPVIQKLKAEKDVNIIVTFFSPSGYENSKNYPFADVVSYMPFDTPGLVKRFLDIVNPDLTVIMRYDIWPNFIWQLKSRNIPCFIIDATMRENSNRKLPVSISFHKSLYKNISKIFTVSKADLESFRSFDIKNGQLETAGDTRYDRVFQKSVAAKEKKLFKDGFFDGKKVFVAGSSWEADEEVLLPAFLKIAKYDDDVIMILVPHEPTIAHLEKLEDQLRNKCSSIRFSYLNDYKGERIIIVDSIGILLTLYYYADLAYVGGSFKQGIHNVLEPAVYGIPVLFGPKIENSQEAQKLVKIGASKVLRDKKEAYRWLRTLLKDDGLREKMGRISSMFVNENLGATDKILKEIHKIL
ncbi:MAG: 3-deoxy-D-manno-octulosonic acid transferase [Ignavibacteria bacterium]|jgi:3-deoxy-D-manno-octulosonic-acid transferase|nr:3-deoxy-D-manno-octulosonic acid transferase [Ignavibacteria bacterium]MCU7502718.1 3-deoxy-D-manno-octulosonic acid transferase [Ignavibacteria bacterium]MCU7517353.1 3-deoxy-D-manno-octulosonic acid transferase [Ignavibacteria bacterium]